MKTNNKNNRRSMIENLEARQMFSATPAVVGYLPDYEYADNGPQIMANLQATHFQGLTQINFFSVLPDANGMLPGTSVRQADGVVVRNTNALTSNGDASTPLTNIDAVVTAAHNAGVKVDIVVGGAGSNSTQLGLDIDAGSQVRANFAASAVQFCKQHHLDGVDVDWEAGWGEASADQITNYGTFLSTLKHAAGTKYQVSAAVDAEELTLNDDTTQAYALDTLAVQSVNTINVMSYDLGNPADNAPLLKTKDDLSAWATYVDSIPNASHSQLLYGVAFYGKATTIDPSIADQWGQVSNDPKNVNVDDASYEQIVNAGNQVDFSVNDVAQSVTESVAGTFNGNAPTETWNFDNRGSVYAKTQIALQAGYGGVMAWAIGQDYGAGSTDGFSDTKSLLPAIHQAITDYNNGGVQTQPPQSLPSISGNVFNDANKNYSQDAGELGLGGFTVFIDTNHDGVWEAGELTTTSDANGNFRFSNLAAGNYDVIVQAKAGYNATNWPDQLATVKAGQTAFVGFGEVAIQ